MINRVSPLPIFLIAAIACDVGTVSEPSNDPVFDLTGTWAYFAQLTSDAGTCEIRGLTLHIVQTETTLSGSTEGGAAECVFIDRFVRQPLESMPLRDGHVAATMMLMSFGEGEMWRHGGNVILGVTMRGTTDMTRDFGEDIGVVHFPRGEWGADRL